MHLHIIDNYCDSIVACVVSAAYKKMVRIPAIALKPYRNDELDLDSGYRIMVYSLGGSRRVEGWSAF
jgi:hypothetical protein